MNIIHLITVIVPAVALMTFQWPQGEPVPCGPRCDAERRYGEDATRVFAAYGEQETFVEVFDRHGHHVIPVVTYYIDNGPPLHWMRRTLSQLWTGSAPSLSPQDHGLVAINELRERGHEMLSEFEIVEGKAKPRPVTRVLNGARYYVFGGILDVEKVITRGERAPTAGELGWAAMNLAVVGGGVYALARPISAVYPLWLQRPALATRPGKPAASMIRGVSRSAAQSLSAAGKSASTAAKALPRVGQSAGVVAVIGLPYVALTHPDFVVTVAGWLSSKAGLPSWVGAFLVYAALSAILLVIARILLRPLAWFGRVVYLVLARLRGSASIRIAPV